MSVFEDRVSCEECGATITHIVCGFIPTLEQDGDYYLCNECLEKKKEEEESLVSQSDSIQPIPAKGQSGRSANASSEDYGGAFDGFRVTSDADEGL